MLASEFVKAYPSDLTPKQIHQGEHTPYMEEAQQYSYKWGRLLHSLLSGERFNSPFAADEALEYRDWLDSGFRQTFDNLAQAPPEVRAHGYNELNFHTINSYLQGSWEALIFGEWQSEGVRRDVLQKAQIGLAVEGVGYYKKRQDFIAERQGTHVLFDPEINPVHNCFTGIMQEFDAGDVALQALLWIGRIHKRKDLVLLPAPLQFERWRKKTNVDYILVDLIKATAVGVQVKSRLRASDFEVADKSRMMFIDGDVDFDSIMPVRIKRDQSTEVIAAWPGLIAATQIANTKLPKVPPNQLTPSQRQLKEAKATARELCSNGTADIERYATRIGTRILSRV